MNQTLDLFKRLAKYPLGKSAFTTGLVYRAPYFGSIHPRVIELKPGYCKVQMKERRSVRNHIGSINAGAMCTLCELTGGLAVEVSLPSNLRWIPKGMRIQYIKKAKGTIFGICELSPDILIPGDMQIPLEIKDESGDTVLKANITFYISERKQTAK